MKNTNPALPGIIIEEDDENGYIVEGTSTTPSIPTTAGYFAPGCTILDLSTGIEYRNSGTTASPSWTNDDLTGTTNTIGNSAKTSANTIKGRTKFDDRPTGGSTGDYTAQIRGEVGKTSGTYIGLDGETHLKSSGATSLRGTQGVAVLDATYTSTGGSLTGTYGQARSDGTYNNAAGFVTGVYGLIEGSAAMTASHVASVWADSHQNNAVTGEHELFYGSNNGTAVMDQMIFLYGDGNALINLDDNVAHTPSYITGPGTAANGTPIKIKLIYKGTPYYLNAYPTDNV